MKLNKLIWLFFTLFTFISVSIALFLFIKQVMGFTLMSLGLVMAASVLACIGFIWILNDRPKLAMPQSPKRDLQQWISGGIGGTTLVLLMQLVLDKKYFVFSIEPMVISILWILGLSILIYAGLFGLIQVILDWKHGT